MSATTLGTGGVALDEAGDTSQSIASGGSAAAVEGTADTRLKLKENPNRLRADSRAIAQDGGTFARWRKKTKVKDDELTSTTTDEPGGPPIKQTTTSEAALPE